MKKKIFTLEKLEKIITSLKKKRKKIALCHGVFDLLHPGHIFHFEQAKKKTDILVVSITADKYVLKGLGRPYFKERLRLHALQSLEYIDYVVLSNHISAVNVIKKIKPNFYIKGSDYKKSEDDITKKIDLEKKEVKKYGGKILFTQGQVFSSSKIINNEFFYNQEQSEFLKKIKKKYSIKTIINFLDNLNKSTPLVVGETIIDDYVFCKSIGKSGKEAYMVMQQKKSEKYLGGVLPIAQNLASISKKVNLLTAIGSKESYKKKIERELKKNINLKFITKKNASTIIKKRFIEEVDNTKLLGIYNITEKENSNLEEQLLIKKFRSLVINSDLVIIADYGHGFFSRKFRDEVQKHDKFLAINAQANAFSAGYHTVINYKKADLILMNETELRQELRDKNSHRNDLIKKLQKKIKCRFLAVTHGKNGATIYSTKSKDLVLVPAFARQVVDKVGAGDALFPVLATCLKSQMPLDISLFMASISAAINAENYASKSIIDKIYFKKFLEHALK